ncbi:MAG: MATE family efflux transporter [Mariniphaga sp.]
MLKSIDFTSAPLPQLIRRLAVPASVGFIFNTLFNVVDTYYGGRISTAALAAMGLTFPVFFIILAMGMGMGTGTTALISQSLGAGRNEEADKIGYQAVTFSVINSVLLMILGLIAAPTLFRILGATENYLEISVKYMDTILYGTVFFLINSILNSLLTARGDTRTYRNYLIAGFVLNLILDPWFIYGGFGFPALGIRGIGFSTVIIQVLGTFYMIYVTRKLKVFQHARFNDFVPRKKYFSALFGQGFPASLNMLTVAIGIFVITYFASHFGKEAVAAYGIATRIEQIALLPTIGLNIAALTLAAQNMGANRPERVYESWKLNIRYGLIIITIGTVLVLLFARQLMQAFTADSQVIAIGIEYLRIAALFFFAYIFLNMSVSTLQGMKRPMYAIFVGVYRQFLMPLPLFILLAITLGWGTKGIWWGIFAVNWSAAIFTFFYTRNQIEKVLKAKDL